jgi:hypothetical protein
MTKDEICGLLRQIHDVLAMQSETNHWAQPAPVQDEYELRGLLASKLKCWHRLTGEEADDLVRFAATQPPAAERNKLAKWMMAKGYATGHGDTIEQLLEELRWQVEERGQDAP